MLKRLHIVFYAAILAALILPSAAFAFKGAAQQAAPMEVRHRTFSPEEINAMSKLRAVISTSFGDIEIKFFPEVAPNHVNNFIELAREGFYDGTVFHRVIPGFMIQGGDPNSKSPDRSSHGTGGPSYVLKAEFNRTPHKRGILSMARKGHPDSAGSQFFICDADAPHLDGKYTVFGEVVSGMRVVDKIVNQPRDRRDNPLERVEIKVRIVEPKAEKPEPAPPAVEEKEPEAKPESGQTQEDNAPVMEEKSIIEDGNVTPGGAQTQ